MNESKYVITITRQFGSMGRPIARKMSELLGIEYYDRDIVEKISQELKLPVAQISNLEERYSFGNLFNMVFPLGFQTNEIQHRIFDVQSKIINDFVDKESCIIVGRCSDYLMREHPNHVNIYIYAPYGARLRNCVESLHMKEQDAKKMIYEVDKARQNYHKHFTGSLPGSEKYHDIMIDSSLLGPDGTADALAYVIRQRFQKA